MSHPSTLTLHQLRYGELSPERTAEVRGHVDDCPRCAGILQQQQATRREFELLPLPAAIKATTRPEPLWRRLLGGRGALPAGLALAAAAVLAFVLVGPGVGPSTGLDPVSTGVDGIRTTGGDDIEILVEGQGVLEEGETLVAGDRIQLRIPPGPWVQAWAHDGGRILLPFDVEPQTATLAPFSLKLDDSGGDERIWLVLAEQPLSEEQARAALDGEASEGIVVHEVILPRAPGG